MKMLNTGCGTSFHQDWVNIDLVANRSGVVTYDLTKGLPFESNTFDVCYSSHVLEHLRKEEADFFIEEQKRVLRTGGVLRIVVPDLEVICRNYLYFLERLLAGDAQYEFRYDYSLLELFDQMTRARSGGDMGRLWAANISDEQMQFIVTRHGREAVDAVEASRKSRKGDARNARGVVDILKGKKIGNVVNRLKSSLAKHLVAGLMGKKAVAAFQEGLFRNSGEVHRIMYDSYSLKRLLLSHGFADIQVCEAGESRIPNFNQYQLDVIEGAVRKPDSLFMEAILA